jgi:hypothetical protein
MNLAWKNHLIGIRILGVLGRGREKAYQITNHKIINKDRYHVQDLWIDHHQQKCHLAC